MSRSRVQIRLQELQDEQKSIRYILQERSQHYSREQLLVFRRRLRVLKDSIAFHQAMHDMAVASHKKKKRHGVRA